MADLLFVAIVIAFFALLVLLVKACDRIIGADLVLVDSDRDQTGSSPDRVEEAA